MMFTAQARSTDCNLDETGSRDLRIVTPKHVGSDTAVANGDGYVIVESIS